MSLYLYILDSWFWIIVWVSINVYVYIPFSWNFCLNWRIDYAKRGHFVAHLHDRGLIKQDNDFTFLIHTSSYVSLTTRITKGSIKTKTKTYAHFFLRSIPNIYDNTKYLHTLVRPQSEHNNENIQPYSHKNFTDVATIQAFFGEYIFI